jgi:hypothetical protein
MRPQANQASARAANVKTAYGSCRSQTALEAAPEAEFRLVDSLVASVLSREVYLMIYRLT